MATQSKFYYFSFLVYLVSFFFPAIVLFDEPVMGYHCTLITIKILLKTKNIGDFLFALFANSANLLTIIIFFMQFKIPLGRFYGIQSIALISAFYWPAYALVQKKGLSMFYAGYWMWALSLLAMTIVMVVARKSKRSEDQRRT